MMAGRWRLNAQATQHTLSSAAKSEEEIGGGSKGSAGGAAAHPHVSTGIKDMGLVEENAELLAICLIDDKIVSLKVNDVNGYKDGDTLYDEMFSFDPAPSILANLE